LAPAGNATGAFMGSRFVTGSPAAGDGRTGTGGKDTARRLF
jgi:hypothetical protein